MKGATFFLLAVCVALGLSACGGPPLVAGSAVDIRFGQPEAWANFPAVCRFLAADGARCTCVLAGPGVLLTAGHCVKTSPGERTGTGTIGIFGQTEDSTATCEVDARLGLAACTVPRVEGIPFATLATAPTAARQKVLLTGFGCQGRGAPPGRFGDATVTVTSSPDSDNLVSLAGRASLCEGDSGGPAFNSQGQVPGINGKTLRLISVSTPSAQRFIQGWAHVNGVEVCGITGSALHCGVSSQRPAP